MRINVTGGEDLGLRAAGAAQDMVYRAVDPDAQIIWGVVIDPNFPPGAVKVTLIATGFSDAGKANAARSRSYPGTTTSTPAQQTPTPQPQPQPTPVPQRPITPAPQPQPQRSAPNMNNEDLDIPPFLRNRNRGK